MIISVHKVYFEARCRQRGFGVEEAMPCVVEQDGDTWSIDVDHPAYPRESRPGFQPAPAGLPPAPLGYGPGTELKALLSRIGITASPTCGCNAYAAQMDSWGPDGCQQRMPEILVRLEEQAAGRGLPFVRFVAEQVVKLAISRARKLGEPVPDPGHAGP